MEFLISLLKKSSLLISHICVVGEKTLERFSTGVAGLVLSGNICVQVTWWISYKENQRKSTLPSYCLLPPPHPPPHFSPHSLLPHLTSPSSPPLIPSLHFPSPHLLTSLPSSQTVVARSCMAVGPLYSVTETAGSEILQMKVTYPIFFFRTHQNKSTPLIYWTDVTWFFNPYKCFLYKIFLLHVAFFSMHASLT